MKINFEKKTLTTFMVIDGSPKCSYSRGDKIYVAHAYYKYDIYTSYKMYIYLGLI